METIMTIVVAALISVGIYLLLSRSLLQMLLGLVVLGNGVNLLILTAGRLTRVAAPIIPPGQTVPVGNIANPLPQALILTAIVIGFAMFSYLLVLALRAYRALDADRTDAMRAAELDGGPQPPLSY